MEVRKDVVSFGEYEFAAGGSIPDLQLAYEAYGEFDGDNAVLLCHALTLGQHAADPPAEAPEPERDPECYCEPTPWWDEMVGPGKPIDTERYHVVCANAPGSCYGSSGPPSTNPETGEPYGPAFPVVRIEDWTDTQRLLLDSLGIERVHAVVGGSMGGTNVLDWAKRYPATVDRIVPIAAATRPNAQSLALDAIARRAITADPRWRGGAYYGRSHPDRGLGLARQLGLVRYLSRAALEGRFGRRPTEGDGRRPFPRGPFADGGPYRAVEAFLDRQAAAFVDRFDANSYLSVLRALDEYDLSAGCGSDAAALADFDGEALLLSFTGDWYYPVEESEAIEAALRSGGASVFHRVVDCEYGHDAFLARADLIAPWIRAFLSEGIAGVADGDPVARSTELRDAG